MCEDSQGRPANMLLFQIQMGVLTSNFKIIIKITRPPVQSSPVQSSPPVQRMYTTFIKLSSVFKAFVGFIVVSIVDCIYIMYLAATWKRMLQTDISI